MRKLSIASVTVVHNSAELLPRQMAALQSQTRKLDGIIVVNNASTDSTLRLLEEKYPNVTVLNLSKNAGVGGALSAGLNYAIKERCHNWVWLLDDDSVPRNDGLEQLVRVLNTVTNANEIAVLAPIPAHVGTSLSYPGLLWRHGWIVLSTEELKQDVCYVDAVISSGSLMRSEAVQKVGPPRSDFFMDFVDFEHCLRFRQAGYKIAIVRDSLMDHSMGSPRTVKILGYSRPWGDHAPWREYYISRNQVFTIWNYFPDWRSKLSTIRRLLRHAFGVALFGSEKRACLRMMFCGFQDGRAGRLGIRFSGD